MILSNASDKTCKKLVSDFLFILENFTEFKVLNTSVFRTWRDIFDGDFL